MAEEAPPSSSDSSYRSTVKNSLLMRLSSPVHMAWDSAEAWEENINQDVDDWVDDYDGEEMYFDTNLSSPVVEYTSNRTLLERISDAPDSFSLSRSTSPDGPGSTDTSSQQLPQIDPIYQQPAAESSSSLAVSPNLHLRSTEDKPEDTPHTKTDDPSPTGTSVNAGSAPTESITSTLVRTFILSLSTSSVLPSLPSSDGTMDAPPSGFTTSATSVGHSTKPTRQISFTATQLSSTPLAESLNEERAAWTEVWEIKQIMSYPGGGVPATTESHPTSSSAAGIPSRTDAEAIQKDTTQSAPNLKRRNLLHISDAQDQDSGTLPMTHSDKPQAADVMDPPLTIPLTRLDESSRPCDVGSPTSIRETPLSVLVSTGPHSSEQVAPDMRDGTSPSIPVKNHRSSNSSDIIVNPPFQPILSPSQEQKCFFQPPAFDDDRANSPRSLADFSVIEDQRGKELMALSTGRMPSHKEPAQKDLAQFAPSDKLESTLHISNVQSRARSTSPAPHSDQPQESVSRLSTHSTTLDELNSPNDVDAFVTIRPTSLSASFSTKLRPDEQAVPEIVSSKPVDNSTASDTNNHIENLYIKPPLTQVLSQEQSILAQLTATNKNSPRSVAASSDKEEQRRVEPEALLASQRTPQSIEPRAATERDAQLPPEYVSDGVPYSPLSSALSFPPTCGYMDSGDIILPNTLLMPSKLSTTSAPRRHDVSETVPSVLNQKLAKHKPSTLLLPPSEGEDSNQLAKRHERKDDKPIDGSEIVTSIHESQPVHQTGSISFLPLVPTPSGQSHISTDASLSVDRKRSLTNVLKAEEEEDYKLDFLVSTRPMKKLKEENIEQQVTIKEEEATEEEEEELTLESLGDLKYPTEEEPIHNLFTPVSNHHPQPNAIEVNQATSMVFATPVPHIPDVVPEDEHAMDLATLIPDLLVPDGLSQQATESPEAYPTSTQQAIAELSKEQEHQPTFAERISPQSNTAVSNNGSELVLDPETTSYRHMRDSLQQHSPGVISERRRSAPIYLSSRGTIISERQRSRNISGYQTDRRFDGERGRSRDRHVRQSDCYSPSPGRYDSYRPSNPDWERRRPYQSRSRSPVAGRNRSPQSRSNRRPRSHSRDMFNSVSPGKHSGISSNSSLPPREHRNNPSDVNVRSCVQYGINRQINPSPHQIASAHERSRSSLEPHPTNDGTDKRYVAENLLAQSDGPFVEQRNQVSASSFASDTGPTSYVSDYANRPTPIKPGQIISDNRQGSFVDPQNNQYVDPMRTRSIDNEVENQSRAYGETCSHDSQVKDDRDCPASSSIAPVSSATTAPPQAFSSSNSAQEVDASIHRDHPLVSTRIEDLQPHLSHRVQRSPDADRPGVMDNSSFSARLALKEEIHPEQPAQNPTQRDILNHRTSVIPGSNGTCEHDRTAMSQNANTGASSLPLVLRIGDAINPEPTTYVPGPNEMPEERNGESRGASTGAPYAPQLKHTTPPNPVRHVTSTGPPSHGTLLRGGSSLFSRISDPGRPNEQHHLGYGTTRGRGRGLRGRGLSRGRYSQSFFPGNPSLEDRLNLPHEYN